MIARKSCFYFLLELLRLASAKLEPLSKVAVPMDCSECMLVAKGSLTCYSATVPQDQSCNMLANDMLNNYRTMDAEAQDQLIERAKQLRDAAADAGEQLTFEQALAVV